MKVIPAIGDLSQWPVTAEAAHRAVVWAEKQVKATVGPPKEKILRTEKTKIAKEKQEIILALFKLLVMDLMMWPRVIYNICTWAYIRYFPCNVIIIYVCRQLILINLFASNYGCHEGNVQSVLITESLHVICVFSGGTKKNIPR